MVLTQEEVNELTRKSYPASPARHVDKVVNMIDAVLDEIDGQAK